MNKPTPGPWKIGPYSPLAIVANCVGAYPLIVGEFAKEEDVLFCLAAFQACFAINPSNPLAVAEAMGGVVSCCAEALTTLSHLGYGDSPMATKLRDALAKLDAK
jgi:hypothetical protein